MSINWLHMCVPCGFHFPFAVMVIYFLKSEKRILCIHSYFERRIVSDAYIMVINNNPIISMHIWYISSPTKSNIFEKIDNINDSYIRSIYLPRTYVYRDVFTFVLSNIFTCSNNGEIYNNGSPICYKRFC